MKMDKETFNGIERLERKLGKAFDLLEEILESVWEITERAQDNAETGEEQYWAPRYDCESCPA